MNPRGYGLDAPQQAARPQPCYDYTWRGATGQDGGGRRDDWSLPPAEAQQQRGPSISTQVNDRTYHEETRQQHSSHRHHQETQYQSQRRQYHATDLPSHTSYHVETEGTFKTEDYRLLGMPHPPELVDSYDGAYSTRRVAPSICWRPYPTTVPSGTGCPTRDPLAWTIFVWIFKLTMLMVLIFVLVRCLTLQADVERLEARLDALSPSMSASAIGYAGPSTPPTPLAVPAPRIN